MLEQKLRPKFRYQIRSLDLRHGVHDLALRAQSLLEIIMIFLNVALELAGKVGLVLAATAPEGAPQVLRLHVVVQPEADPVERPAESAPLVLRLRLGAM